MICYPAAAIPERMATHRVKKVTSCEATWIRKSGGGTAKTSFVKIHPKEKIENI